MSIILHGYRYSVYTRIVKMALHEKALNYEMVEVNPFADNLPATYLNIHPFGRVPVLIHGEFKVFETAAILQYIDRTFGGTALIPDDLKTATRITQLMSVIDNYGYRPLVRQVFSHRVFRPLKGLPGDDHEVLEGLENGKKVLTVLEQFAKEGLVLNGNTLTLADIYLAPMIGYFIRAREGLALFNQYDALTTWWRFIEDCESYCLTDPGLPGG